MFSLKCFKAIYGTIVGLILGIVLFLNNENFAEMTSSKQTLLYVLVVVLSIYISFILHEIIMAIGSLIFSLAGGYKFFSFRITKFIWFKTNGKIQLTKTRPEKGGANCILFPPDMKNGKFPFVLHILGGPMLCLIVSIIFLPGYFIFFDSPFISAIIFTFSITGIAASLHRAVPLPLGTFGTPAYIAITLSKSKAAAKSFWVDLKIIELSAKGVPFKNMPSEWFIPPSDDDMKNRIAARLGVYACDRLVDEKKFEEAYSLINHMLEIDSAIEFEYRSFLTCDKIFLEAIGENRREIIDGILTEEQKTFMLGNKEHHSVLRTLYVLALIDNDIKGAQTIRDAFEKNASESPFPVFFDIDRELMNIAQDKLQFGSK